MKRPTLHFMEAAAAYWAMRMVLQYRPVGWSVAALLPTIGTAVVLSSLVLLAVDLLAMLPDEGLLSDVVARVGKWSRWLVVGFVWLAIALVFNARLDRAGADVHRAEVVGVGARTLTTGVALVHSWMDVRSSTLGANVVRIALGPTEQGTFWREEEVLVWVRPGRFGIPWIARLERDLEGYYRSALQKIPGARGPSLALVAFLVDHMRWDEARDESVRYLAAHPEDVDFAVYAGSTMSVRGWLDASAEMLSLAAARWPGRYLLGRLAWVETRRGDRARAMAVAERAAARYPDGWEFPLVLAYNLERDGDVARAAAALDRAATLRPNVPDVTQALARLERDAKGVR